MNTIMKKILLCLFLTVALNGCNIYKKYERADIQFVDSLYRHGAVQEDTMSIASLSWRELFTDRQLQQLIETGLKNNTDLGIARLKVQESMALLKSSKLAYLPSLSLTPEGTITSVDGNKASKTYNIALSADWELDIFGKLLNAERGALADLQQSEAYCQAVQTQLVATIANSYYMLLMLDSQLDITRRTAETWGESLRTVKALKKAGQLTEMEVAQTEAGKISVDASVIALQRQINEVENSLSILLGLPPQDIERSTLESQEFPDTLTTGVPLQLVSRRPDVRQSEAQLASAYYATNAARSNFYPSIVLSGSAGWTNTAGGIIANPGQWLLSAIGSLVQPIFNRGKNVANLKIAEAQQQQALLSFRQSLLDAGAEVNDALIQWQTARQRVELGKQQVFSLNSALHSSELIMQYTSQNYLSVLTAKQSLLQAELNVVADRFDEIQGIINLYHALGGGC